jgi:hypothetical protein
MNVTKLESSWKRPKSKFSSQATYSNTNIFSNLFNKLIKEGHILDWLMTGVTVLTPKNENAAIPKNYRPTTCLPTIYKTITSIIRK